MPIPSSVEFHMSLRSIALRSITIEDIALRSIEPKAIALRSIALETDVHPGFATDWQQPFVVLLTQASGLSVIHETVFEQRGVEFPDFWSINASTIVTTKYFRGAVGSDTRESSLRQLIDREELTNTKAGR